MVMLQQQRSASVLVCALYMCVLLMTADAAPANRQSESDAQGVTLKSESTPNNFNFFF